MLELPCVSFRRPFFTPPVSAAATAQASNRVLLYMHPYMTIMTAPQDTLSPNVATPPADG